MTYTNLPYLKSRSVLLDSSIKQILIFHIVGIIVSILIEGFYFKGLMYTLIVSNPLEFIKQPWTLITNTVIHPFAIYTLFSTISIYFSSRLFEMYFGAQRIWPVFLFVTIFGTICILLSSIFTPSTTYVSLSSITSMSLFFVLAAYDPKLKINLFFLNQVRLVYVICVFFIFSILPFVRDRSAEYIVGYMAVLAASVLVGILFRKSIDITSPYRHAFYWIEEKFGFRPKMKIIQGGRALSDDDYNHNRKEKQLVLDEILDKINQKGIHSLTKKEKEFLEKFGKE